MLERLHHDMAQAPLLFSFRPLGEDELSLSELWTPPADLLHFWREFGVGHMFETEEIVNPLPGSFSIAAVTQRERALGFPSHLSIFHLGSWASGFDRQGFEVCSGRDYSARRRFRSLTEWYVEVIRAEFASRYGLRG